MNGEYRPSRHRATFIEAFKQAIITVCSQTLGTPLCTAQCREWRPYPEELEDIRPPLSAPVLLCNCTIVSCTCLICVEPTAIATVRTIVRAPESSTY